MSKNPRRGLEAAYTEAEIVRDIEMAGICEPGGAAELWAETDPFGRHWLVERVALKLFRECETYSQRALRVRAWLLDNPDPDPEGTQDDEIEEGADEF